MKKLITIFGPSDCKAGDPIYDRAYKLGGLLGEAGFAIVTGGYDGVMEAASKGAHEAGGGVVGVTATVYFNRGRVMNQYVKKELRVSSAVDRLMELISLADGYVACGISPGTIAEVSTVWEFFIKKFIEEKPLILLGSEWKVWDFFIKKFVEEKPLILLGSEWKAYCDSLFSQAGYRGRGHYVTIIENPEEALEILLTAFGKQEKMPELTVIQ
jgi:uncharacterized protein (TIGR00725 family)